MEEDPGLRRHVEAEDDLAAALHVDLARAEREAGRVVVDRDRVRTSEAVLPGPAGHRRARHADEDQRQTADGRDLRVERQLCPERGGAG